VTAANYNAPGQVVIAGENLAVDRAIEIAKEFGAKRAVKLDVSGPFHSRLMLGARDEFARYIQDIEFSSPVIPVIQNVNVEISNDVEQIKSNLVDQLSSPVRWTETMHKLVGLGVDQIVECGPGAVLRGLAKRTSRELSLAGLDTVVDMENFLGS
jgi:[acyl-carrier-protein] S-malonyltransferase